MSDLSWGFNPRNVYVISDSDYKEILKTKALDEIQTLKNRRIIYQEYLEKIDREILDIQKRAGLLDDPSAPLSRGSNDDVHKEQTDETEKS